MGQFFRVLLDSIVWWWRRRRKKDRNPFLYK